MPALATRCDSDSGRLLWVLECPECSCPYETPLLLESEGSAELLPEHRILLLVFGAFDQPDSEPCPHCERSPHSMPLGDWADACLAYAPREYADPEPDPEGGQVAVSREARIVLYRMRLALGYALHHPEDVHEVGAVGDQAVSGKRCRGLASPGRRAV